MIFGWVRVKKIQKYRELYFNNTLILANNNFIVLFMSKYSEDKRFLMTIIFLIFRREDSAILNL